MKAYWLIFVGGGAGNVLRYVVGKFMPATLAGSSFPTAILLVNVLASVLLGVVMGWAMSRGGSHETRLLLGVGVCGGLSTFSSFSYDTLVLLQNGRTGTALLNVVLNVTLCLLASVGGWLAGQKI